MSYAYDQRLCDMLAFAAAERLHLALQLNGVDYEDMAISCEAPDDLEVDPYFLTIEDRQGLCESFLMSLDNVLTHADIMFGRSEENGCWVLAWEKMDNICQFLEKLENIVTDVHRERAKSEMQPYPGDKAFADMIKNDPDFLYFVPSDSPYDSLERLFQAAGRKAINLGGYHLTYELDLVRKLAQRQEQTPPALSQQDAPALKKV